MTSIYVWTHGRLMEVNRRDGWPRDRGQTLPDISDSWIQHWYLPVFFMGRTPLHTWEHFSERITFFYRAIVSEVHVLQAQDLHFRTPLKLNQIVYFKVGRISTRRDQSNAPKIIFVRPPDPEIVRSELWARKIAACDAMWPTANLFENGNKTDMYISKRNEHLRTISTRDPERRSWIENVPSLPPSLHAVARLQSKSLIASPIVFVYRHVRQSSSFVHWFLVEDFSGCPWWSVNNFLRE